MEKFIAHRLTFKCRADGPIQMPPHKGSMFRGALFEALRSDFCLNKVLPSCVECPTAKVCPICKLVATVDHESQRGEEVPRPFSLQPDISATLRYEDGDTFTFGLTLFGSAASLYPYVVLAVQRMGELGLGKKWSAPGRFKLAEIWAINPLTMEAKLLFDEKDRLVQVPDIPIVHEQVLHHCRDMSGGGLGLEFLTPLRLVIDGQLVHQLTFISLIRRLLRRLTDLYRGFSDGVLDIDFPALLRQAESVRVSRDETRWLDLSSFSRRRELRTPIGGLVGEMEFEGDVQPFLPYLVWGHFTHVGKDATRGHGWYTTGNRE